MKTTDWYTRTLLTLLAVLLGYVAAELRTLTYQQAALTGARQVMQAAALRQPATNLAKPNEGIVDVHIVDEAQRRRPQPGHSPRRRAWASGGG